MKSDLVGWSACIEYQTHLITMYNFLSMHIFRIYSCTMVENIFQTNLYAFKYKMYLQPLCQLLINNRISVFTVGRLNMDTSLSSI